MASQENFVETSTLYVDEPRPIQLPPEKSLARSENIPATTPVPPNTETSAVFSSPAPESRERVSSLVDARLPVHNSFKRYIRIDAASKRKARTLATFPESDVDDARDRRQQSGPLWPVGIPQGLRRQGNTRRDSSVVLEQIEVVPEESVKEEVNEDQTPTKEEETEDGRRLKKGRPKARARSEEVFKRRELKGELRRPLRLRRGGQKRGSPREESGDLLAVTSEFP